MKYLMVLLFALVGCGSVERHVSSAMSSGVDRYLKLAPNHGHWDDLTSVDFGTPKAGALGECRVTSKAGVTERRVIVLRIPESEILLQVTIAHELAHCLHDRHHDDLGQKLMNTQRVGDSEYWETHLDDQISALF